jgi:hypothetical protein
MTLRKVFFVQVTMPKGHIGRLRNQIPRILKSYEVFVIEAYTKGCELF